MTRLNTRKTRTNCHKHAYDKIELLQSRALVSQKCTHFYSKKNDDEKKTATTLDQSSLQNKFGSTTA